MSEAQIKNYLEMLSDGNDNYIFEIFCENKDPISIKTTSDINYMLSIRDNILSKTDEFVIPERKYRDIYTKKIFRSKDISETTNFILSSIDQYHIYMSKFSTRYPISCKDQPFGRQIGFGRVISYDVDSKTEGVSVDPELIMDAYKELKFKLPTNIISSGTGAHIDYVLKYFYTERYLFNHWTWLLENRIKKLTESTKWKSSYKLDIRPITQFFRVPWTINHKCNKQCKIYYSGKIHELKPIHDPIPPIYTKNMLRLRRKELKKARFAAFEKEKGYLDTPENSGVKEKGKERYSRYIDGADKISITLNQQINVDKDKFLKVLKLLVYGKRIESDFLPCRVVGKYLGVTRYHAAKFLKECVENRHLCIIKESEESELGYRATRYEICVNYTDNSKSKTTGKKTSPLEYSKIDGPGQSNKAICQLARVTYIYKLDKEIIFNKWIEKYYHLTSGNHSKIELYKLFENVYSKFEIGRYIVY